MESLGNVQTAVQGNLNTILQNPYIMAVLKVGLILYASKLAPTMPSYVQDTFKNTFVKIIAIALLAYISEVDFQLAILLAIVLVLGANFLGGRGVFESYNNVGFNSVGSYESDITKYTTLLGKPAQVGKFKLIESLSDNYPGCNKVTLKDLLALFQGNAVKLQKTVHYAFSELNAALPAGKDKENLLRIARAAGLPHNVALSDETAPFVATLLLNYGYKVSDDCQVPQ
jgi:hypothetical protein